MTDDQKTAPALSPRFVCQARCEFLIEIEAKPGVVNVQSRTLRGPIGPHVDGSRRVAYDVADQLTENALGCFVVAIGEPKCLQEPNKMPAR